MPENDLEPDDTRGAKAKKNARKSKKRPQPLRSSRMELEILERRDMMASSAVLNASVMSAFFEQSALYYIRQPVNFPNVTWISHLEPSYTEPPLLEPIQLIARTNALVQMELSEDGRESNQLALPPGLGSRTASGARRMLRLESEWPAHVFAPTIDMSDSSIADLARIARTEGILFFDLAYIAADGENRPSWCGMAERTVDGGGSDAVLRERIHELRALGGDVIVTFGGPQGKPLAEAITDVKQLKNAYRGVVQAYALSRINFDLDGAALDDHGAIERRWQATAALQREMTDAGLPLEVWVTLPATPSGLSNAALEVLRSAQENGVHLDGVNLKTDLGNPTAPTADAKLGRWTIEAAINAFYQLPQALARDGDGDGSWTGIGITPVIGQDAGAGVPFTPMDARELYDFAQRHGIGMLGMSQLDRDWQNKDLPQGGRESDAGSEQDAAEIREIFGDFIGSPQP